MTIDEAINRLNDRKMNMSMCINKEECNAENTAIDMAIEALKCVNSSAFKDGYKKAISDIEQKMYHKSFVEDSEYNKWDCGLWVRYKLFEQVIEEVSE